MAKRIEAPELFNDCSMVRGRQSLAVIIPVSPEGIYIGNGEYKDPQDTLFKVTGFEKFPNGSIRWTGIAYIKMVD